MFFDNVAEIAKIASRTGTSVFVVPKDLKVEIPGALILQPEKKPSITIEQVTAITAKTNTHQHQDLYILIRPADKMTDAAANALLKTLEQPGEHIHFVLVTDQPSRLLSTILSRAAIYYLRPDPNAFNQVQGDKTQKALAKELLVAKGQDLVDLALKIAKKRDNVQDYVLEILALAIEMAYKSYFMSKNPAFLQKIEHLLLAHREISTGGNIKLQIVANLC